MKFNRIYSIFSKGQPYGSSLFSRQVDESAYAWDTRQGLSMLQALTPYKDELLRAAYAEHLTQFLLKSEMAEKALELDPVNTYRKAQMLFPDPGEEIIEEVVSDPFIVYVADSPEVILERGAGRTELRCIVNTAANTVTYNDQVFPYSVVNGMSTKVGLIPGLSVRIRSDFSDPVYVFTIRYTLPAAVDWVAVRERVEKTSPVWLDPSLSTIWEQDPRWDHRLAAYMMSTVELMNRE